MILVRRCLCAMQIYVAGGAVCSQLRPNMVIFSLGALHGSVTRTGTWYVETVVGGSNKAAMA